MYVLVPFLLIIWSSGYFSLLTFYCNQTGGTMLFYYFTLKSTQLNIQLSFSQMLPFTKLYNRNTFQWFFFFLVALNKHCLSSSFNNMLLISIWDLCRIFLIYIFTTSLGMIIYVFSRKVESLELSPILWVLTRIAFQIPFTAVSYSSVQFSHSVVPNSL